VSNEQPLLTFQRRVRWRNKHLNVERQVERLYDVWNRWADGSRPNAQVWRAGLLALQQIVRDAEAQGRRVRALGGAWSLSEAAITNDFMLNTKPLNFIDVGLAADSCATNFVGTPQHLVFAQCGASVLELNQALETQGLALPTSGAANGQSIAGAVATGTHGSANQFGSMQEYVVGLHLVGEGGKHYWLERASRPVVSGSFLAKLGAELKRDDELFAAALVSFGSFGLVHAVLLEVAPLYVLERHVRRYDFPEVEHALTTLDVESLGLAHGATLPYHFEVVVNPFKLAAGGRGAFVRTMYKVAQPPPGATLPPLTTMGTGDDVLGIVGFVADCLPAAIPAALELVAAEQIKPVSFSFATPGQTFGTTGIRGSVLSMEFSLAPADVVAALRCIARVADEFPFAGLLAVRYVKASSALLAFTNARIATPIVATIEIPCSGAQRSLEAFDRIGAALDHAQIRHAFHWGQCLPPAYGLARLTQIYGDRVERWLAARRRFLPSAAGRRCFANGYLERLGLAD
jgi:FAD/FMN-containing dehydrogenase